ncbi:MAG: hypothetical protein LBI13_10105 [Streptococcaceae bacterium]|jgi:biotin carboxyl carrier protein|nr:hypothetical protein [Streptococcaceae bacterium]
MSVRYEAAKHHPYRIFLSKLVGTVYVKIPYERKLYKSGELLLVIESLKIPNEVCMEEEGYLEDIMVNDGDFVMYDTPLLLIRPIEIKK